MARRAGPPEAVLLCEAAPRKATFSLPLKIWTSASDRYFSLPGSSTRTNRPSVRAVEGGRMAAVMREMTKLPLVACPGP